MQYFYSINGTSQNGPVEREQLLAVGVTRDTMVWREGMAQWTRAGDLQELADLFGPAEMTPISPQGVYQPQYAVPTVQPTSGFAIASLVLGILGLCCCNTFIMAILAVIFGHLAKSEIRKGLKTGEGMATAGLVMGYIGLLMGALLMGAALLNGVYNASSRSTFIRPPVVTSPVIPHP